ncbi:MAG: hypothetical protein ACJA2G_002845 [Cognaticolwellia sp.]|jgi:hypothetical protein
MIAKVIVVSVMAVKFRAITNVTKLDYLTFLLNNLMF